MNLAPIAARKLAMEYVLQLDHWVYLALLGRSIWRPFRASRFGWLVPKVKTRLKPWAESYCPFGTKNHHQQPAPILVSPREYLSSKEPRQEQATARRMLMPL